MEENCLVLRLDSGCELDLDIGSGFEIMLRLLFRLDVRLGLAEVQDEDEEVAAAAEIAANAAFRVPPLMECKGRLATMMAWMIILDFALKNCWKRVVVLLVKWLKSAADFFDFRANSIGSNHRSLDKHLFPIASKKRKKTVTCLELLEGCYITIDS